VNGSGGSALWRTRLQTVSCQTIPTGIPVAVRGYRLRHDRRQSDLPHSAGDLWTEEAVELSIENDNGLRVCVEAELETGRDNMRLQLPSGNH
jgi:hypothetical protein